MAIRIIRHKKQSVTMTELKLRCSGCGRAPTGRYQAAKWKQSSRGWAAGWRRHKSLALLRTKRAFRQLQHPLSLLSNFIGIVSHTQPGLLSVTGFQKHIKNQQQSYVIEQSKRDAPVIQSHREDIKLWMAACLTESGRCCLRVPLGKMHYMRSFWWPTCHVCCISWTIMLTY